MKKIFRSLAPMFFQRGAGFFLFRLSFKKPLSDRARFYFLMYFLYLIVCVILIERKNPEVFHKRRQISPESPLWEKFILFLYWPLHFFVFYFVAGRSYTDPGWKAFFVGHLLFFLSTALSCWALLVNPFFDSTAHVQRGQQVIRHGPYGYLRHPGYLAIFLGAGGQAFLFPGLYPRLLLLFLCLLILLRTFLEDAMLLRELPGYHSYAKTTKYRLFPYFW